MRYFFFIQTSKTLISVFVVRTCPKVAVFSHVTTLFIVFFFYSNKFKLSKKKLGLRFAHNK